MQTFLENFHKSGKYSAEIPSHQVEFRREKHFTNKNIFIYINLTDWILYSGQQLCFFVRNSEIANNVQTKCTVCGGVYHCAEKNQKDQTGKEKSMCGCWFVQQTYGTDN